MKKYGYINIFALVVASLFIACGVVLMSTYTYLNEGCSSEKKKVFIDETIHNIEEVIKYSLKNYSAKVEQEVENTFPYGNINNLNNAFQSRLAIGFLRLSDNLKRVQPSNIIDEYRNKGVSFIMSVNKTTITSTLCKLDLTININYGQNKLEHRVIYSILPCFNDKDKRVEISTKVSE